MIWTLLIAIMGLLMPTGSKSRDQGEMLSQLKRHEVQVLLRAGFTPADVATRAQVSNDSVRRVHQEDAVEHTDDAAARATDGYERPDPGAGSRLPPRAFTRVPTRRSSPGWSPSVAR